MLVDPSRPVIGLICPVLRLWKTIWVLKVPKVKTWWIWSIRITRKVHSFQDISRLIKGLQPIRVHFLQVKFQVKSKLKKLIWEISRTLKWPTKWMTHSSLDTKCLKLNQTCNQIWTVIWASYWSKSINLEALFRWRFQNPKFCSNKKWQNCYLKTAKSTNIWHLRAVKGLRSKSLSLIWQE